MSYMKSSCNKNKFQIFGIRIKDISDIDHHMIMNLIEKLSVRDEWGFFKQYRRSPNTKAVLVISPHVLLPGEEPGATAYRFESMDQSSFGYVPILTISQVYELYKTL